MKGTKEKINNNSGIVLMVIIVLTISLSCIHFINAELNPCGGEEYYLGEFDKDSEFNITQFCSTCDYVNFTSMKYPNGSFESFNIEMNKEGQNFYYPFSNTSQNGCYTYTTLDEIAGATRTDFMITNTGRRFTDSQGIVSMGILFGAILLAFLFSKFSTKLMERDETFPIGFIFVFISLALGVYSLFLSYTFSIDIIEYSSLSELSQTVFLIILWLVVSIAVISVALMVIAFIREVAKVVEVKKFGEGWNPISHSYD